MKLYTLWRYNTGEGDMPWMVESYDEYTAEEHGGEPRFYTDAREPGDRELVVEIPESAVMAMFATPAPVKGKVLP